MYLHPPAKKIKGILLVVCVLFLQSFVQAQAKLPHVVFIAGEDEYGSHWSMERIAADLQRRFRVRTTVIHAWRSGVHDFDMPGDNPIPQYDTIQRLEIIKDADLIVLYFRFLIPPPEQYQIFQQYFDAGKPAIAFRTTSHGFWPDDQKGWFVPFFGGHYKGHMENTEGTTTIVPAEQLGHPILRGVPKMMYMNDVMGIYVTAPLSEGATPLMFGKSGTSGPAQPVSWTYEYKKRQKIFYTSLGGLESFLNPGFINMVYNAVYWALDREVPEHGVLSIKDLKPFQKEPPFEKDSFGEVADNPFNKPPGMLEWKNRLVLDAEFQPPAVPQPPKLSMPAGATLLFDGKDLSKWRHWDPSADPVAILPDARAVTPSPPYEEARWPVFDNITEAKPGFGSILTKAEFGNYKLHIDFLIPQEPDYIPPRYKGSGGIYLDGRYQIKILDSYGSKAGKMSHGSIYTEIAPAASASKPPNAWQSMDIEYRQYNHRRPEITVILNGTKVHDRRSPLSTSPYAIRESGALFVSSSPEAAGKYNMNKREWSAEIQFRTLTGGDLITNAPEKKGWDENSAGLMVQNGKLFYRMNDLKHQIKSSDKMALSSGKWQQVIMSARKGFISFYINGKFADSLKIDVSPDFDDHVFRIGQGTDVFRLGASDLPVPFPGRTFDGEIKSVRFYSRSLDKAEITKLSQGKITAADALSLEWKASPATPENIKRVPIRIEADLSKIRYANIWLQPLPQKDR